MILRKFIIIILFTLTWNVFAKTNSNNKINFLINSEKYPQAKKLIAKIADKNKQFMANFYLLNHCFKNANYSEAEITINNLLEKIPPNYQGKLISYIRRIRAMNEYIKINSPKAVEETLKNAQKFLNNNKKITILESIETVNNLLMRIIVWHENDIIQYEELSNLTLEILDKINDEANIEFAVKKALLKSKILSLTGQNQEAMAVIEECLVFYFPNIMKNILRNKPRIYAVRKLMQSIAREAVIIASKTDNLQRKIKYYSKAANYFVKSVEKISANDEEFIAINSEVQQCKVALKLLSYNLSLPTKFKSSRSKGMLIYYEMIRNKRFKTAEKVLSEQIKKITKADKKAPNYLHLLLAISYSEQNKFTECVKQCDYFKNTNSMNLTTIDRIEKMAQKALKKGFLKQSLLLYQIVNTFNKKHPDRKYHLLNSAIIAEKIGQHKMAASYFYSRSKMTFNKQEKSQFLFSSAINHYNANNSITANEIAIKAHKLTPKNGEIIYFIAKEFSERAQDKKQHKFNNEALKYFKILMTLQNLSKDLLKKGLLSGSAIALKQNDYDLSLKWLNRHRKEFPKSENDNFNIAKTLLHIYSIQPNFPAQKKLLTRLLNNKKRTEDVINLAHKYATNHLKKDHYQKVLKLYQLLEKNSVIKSKLLLEIITNLEKIITTSNQTKLPYRKLIISLIKKQEIKKITDSISGELLYLLAKNQFVINEKKSALNNLQNILQQNKVYSFYEVKLLNGKILTSINKHSEAQKNYTEMILQPLNSQQTITINTLLAESYFSTNDYKKAIAIAWLAVPLSGKLSNKKPIKKLQLKALNLIKTASIKINSPEDLQDVNEILNLIKK